MSRWNRLRNTVQAGNALQTGNRNNSPLDSEPLSRGFQRKRTDKPPPADDRPRPAPVHSQSAPVSHSPYDSAVTGGYAPPGQQRPPQQNPYHDPHNQGTYSHYNAQQGYLPRHSTLPSQSSAFNQSVGPPIQPAYSEADGQPRYLPHQGHNDPYYQDPEQYGPSSSSSSGQHQGYPGQSYQEPYSQPNMNPGGSNHDRSDSYGQPSQGQGQAYTQFSQSPSSDAPPLGPTTATPANFPYGYGVPPNTDYNGGDNYNGGESYHGDDNYHGGDSYHGDDSYHGGDSYNGGDGHNGWPRR